MSSRAVAEAVARLAARDATRTEADIQADIYLLLTAGGLHLETHQVARLEVPTDDGTRRRLDIEVGHCAIEVKKDLRNGAVFREALKQLAGYVAAQSVRYGTRYVGILTDGTEWFLFHLDHLGMPSEVDSLSLSLQQPDHERLLVWLGAILATEEAVRPIPIEIARRLGANSPAHRLDQATLRDLFDAASRSPELRLKRDLWAKLLRTAFGKAFTDDEDLFIDHTLLVLTAEAIAHAVVGFDVSRTGGLDPVSLAQGTAFASAQIHGVVEADFFDWPLHVQGGRQFVAELAHRVSRFDWSHVEHDVLKVLYESVIPSTTRESLGEYYTPDWLAHRMVADAVREPLRERVLDPACGSGTFLFHAVRSYLDAADAAGLTNHVAVAGVASHVVGLDIHPVAVAFARVTYLMAIGNERLSAPDRAPLVVPVYLGDSLQWEQRRDLFGGAEVITVSTTGDDLVSGGGALFGDDLRFPRSILRDAGVFDRLVMAMSERAREVSKRDSRAILAPLVRQLGLSDIEGELLSGTLEVMRRLHASGRDHIWGYYVRNLIRPLWLAERGNQVDVLVGNPPWLRYSKMTKAMQERYKALASERGLLTGGLGASARDLSTLFAVRSIELYLKHDGRFSFVMPHGVLSRKPHDGFRSGQWHAKDSTELTVAFDEAWDTSEAPTGFPMVSCVVHGVNTVRRPRRMSSTVQAWSGRPPDFQISPKTISVLGPDDDMPVSPYKARFRQGAILVPRCLLFVEEAPAGPLGAGFGRTAVQSRRTTTEKEPWKSLDSIRGNVERAFVRPVHLGATLLPYRTLDPLRAVLPVNESQIYGQGVIEGHSGLGMWWARAEELWAGHKVDSDRSTLLERIDFHRQLSAQLPAVPHRVVYSKAGNLLSAARIDDVQAVIDHKLYWAAVRSVEEARYLEAILNSTTLMELVKPFQAVGLFGGRDFDKNVFAAPFPYFDEDDRRHLALVDLAEQAEAVAIAVKLESDVDFKRARRLIRNAIDQSGLSAAIDFAVRAVMPPAAYN